MYHAGITDLSMCHDEMHGAYDFSELLWFGAKTTSFLIFSTYVRIITHVRKIPDSAARTLIEAALQLVDSDVEDHLLLKSETPPASKIHDDARDAKDHLLHAAGIYSCQPGAPLRADVELQQGQSSASAATPFRMTSSTRPCSMAVSQLSGTITGVDVPGWQLGLGFRVNVESNSGVGAASLGRTLQTAPFGFSLT